MTRLAFVAISAIFTTHLCLAQDVTGTWGGAMPRVGVGGTLTLGQGARWIVSLSKDRHGNLTGTMLRAPGGSLTLGGSFIMQLQTITLNGSKVSFAVDTQGGTRFFAGTLSDDGNSIDGWFMNLPLKLERSGHARNAKSTPAKAAPAAVPLPGAPPAEVTPATAAESSAVLARALAKLKGTSERLLRYTCLETIERTYYSEPVKLGAYAMSEAPD